MLSIPLLPPRGIIFGLLGFTAPGGNCPTGEEEGDARIVDGKTGGFVRDLVLAMTN